MNRLRAWPGGCGVSVRMAARARSFQTRAMLFDAAAWDFTGVPTKKARIASERRGRGRKCRARNGHRDLLNEFIYARKVNVLTGSLRLEPGVFEINWEDSFPGCGETGAFKGELA